MMAEHELARRATHPLLGRFVVIVNQQAGGVRRQQGLAGRLGRLLGDRGEVAATEDLGQMVAAVRRARMAGVDTLGICGGDGTNVHVLTAIDEAWRGAPWPRLVLLAGGSVNTAARNLGSAGNAERQLAALLASGEPHVRRQVLLRVNEHVGFLFGTHMVARVMDAYYAGPMGLVGCALLAAELVGGAALGGRLARSVLEPEPLTLELDGRSLGTRPISGLLACVVQAPAVGMRATHRAGEDGGFHLVAADTGPGPLLREVGRLWTGLPVRALAVDRVAHEATLTFPGERRYTLDGDMFSGTRLKLAATPPVELVSPGLP